MITIKQAIEDINKANPFASEFFNCEESVIDYAKNRLTTHKFNPIHLERQKAYKEIIKKKVDELFTKEEDVRINFDEDLILDTTDHHNILNYPTIVGAHMLSRFDTLLDRETKGDYFVLDTGNVPFGDALHKRGVEIGGKHLNLYPKKLKTMLVARYPLYNFDIMERVRKSGLEFNKKEMNFLKKFQEIIDSIDFSTCKRISDQIIKINHRLWLEFFDPKIRDKVRRCITLEHDEILIKYLTNHLLKDKNNIVYKSLFDPDFRKTVLKEFEGVYGAWNYSGPDTGTYFFWGYCQDDGKEYRLKLESDFLVEENGKIEKIKFDPKSIILALKKGILLPAIFTRFSIVSFHLGAKTMGGPGQTDYSKKLFDAWLKVLEKHDKKELELVKQTSVMNWNCGDVAFSRDKNGNIFREWAFDMAMNHTFTKEYLDKLKKMEFKYLNYPVVPISYYRLMPADKREKVDCEGDKLYEGFKWVK